MLADESPPKLNPVARADASSDELAIAFSGPSYAVGRFFISITGTGVRVAFAEISSDFGKVPVRDAVSFRTAVTLSPLDAIALHRILRDMLRDTEVAAIKDGVIPPENT